MSVKATLYTTDHCQLCDAAFDWLLQSAALRGVQLETVDVSASDELLARFGARVPVLVIAQQALDWPFAEAGVAALIAAQRE